MINKTIATSYGVDAVFWAPIKSEMNHRSGVVETLVGGWPSQAQYDAGAQPLETRRLAFGQARIAEVLGQEVPLTTLVVALVSADPDFAPPEEPAP